MSHETILVWMLSLNREYTQDEYDDAYKLIKLCFPGDTHEYSPKNPDSFRQLLTQLLPVLMMRHRRVPRAKWRDHVTSNGKHWIEHVVPFGTDGSQRPRLPCIGYQLAYHNSLCGMSVTQGAPAQVVNIGLGIRQHKVEPRGVSVQVYLESISHKLTGLEIANIGNGPDDLVLKRISMLLALKESYMKAIGQPVGFDYSRLEFDMPKLTATGDGIMLQGWEFRVFTSKLGVARGDHLKLEQYECVCAFYRGHGNVNFIFHDSSKLLESWVQFINIDQLMAVKEKLSA